MKHRTYNMLIFAVAVLSLTILWVNVPKTTAQTQARQELTQVKHDLAQLLRRYYDICPSRWRYELELGDEDDDVRRLQQFLNMHPDTRLALYGPGSPGQETEHFGPLTANALRRFQILHHSLLMDPFGRSGATGEFDSFTRTLVNEQCSSQVRMRDILSRYEDGEPEDDEDDSGSRSGREARIRNFEIESSPDNTTISEGRNRRVIEAEFDVEDAEVSVRRVDVLFEAVNQNNEDEPWEFIDVLVLRHGSSRVATERADSEDDWSEVSNDVYRFRFDEDVDLREDRRNSLSIEVIAQDNLSSSDTPQDFRVYFASSLRSDRAIRLVDEIGVTHYLGDADEYRTVTFEE